METFSFIVILGILTWTVYVLVKPARKEDNLRRSINRKIDEENRAADRSKDFG